MNENGGYRVEFKGHCDAVGSPEFNQALSEKRSNAAKSYINSKGIEHCELEKKILTRVRHGATSAK